MNHIQTRVVSTLLFLLGGSVLGYLLWQIPPRYADGQLDLIAVGAFLLALLLVLTALGAHAAMMLHQRWPGLSGLRRKKSVNDSERGQVALRQGLFAAVVICVSTLFALLQIFDWLLVLLVIIIAFLLEAYLQSRER